MKQKGRQWDRNHDQYDLPWETKDILVNHSLQVGDTSYRTTPNRNRNYPLKRE